MLFFKTTNQGTLETSAGTIDMCWIDEPCPQQLFGELVKIISEQRTDDYDDDPHWWGDVLVLRKLTETKPPKIKDIHAAVTVQNCTPEGCNSLMTQEDIDKLSDTYLSIDRAARLEGSWDLGAPMDGQIFEQFGEQHISDAPMSPRLGTMSFPLE